MQNQFLTVSTSIRFRCEEAERRLLASGESAIAAVLTSATEGTLASGFSLPEVYCIPVPVEIFIIKLGKIHERDRQCYWTKRIFPLQQSFTYAQSHKSGSHYYSIFLILDDGEGEHFSRPLCVPILTSVVANQRPINSTYEGIGILIFLKYIFKKKNCSIQFLNDTKTDDRTRHCSLTQSTAFKCSHYCNHFQDFQSFPLQLLNTFP